MRFRFALLASLVFTFLLPTGVQAQVDPPLKTSAQVLLKSYLKNGPSKDELARGTDLSSWALVKGLAIPEFLARPELDGGSWVKVWAPAQAAIKESGFTNLTPLDALNFWAQTRKKPQRFVRLLAVAGHLNANKPAERKRGLALRESLTPAIARMKALRSSSRFEKGGWKYTAATSLNPGTRVIRVALRGSKPCRTSGRSKTVNLSLKGRLFADPGSETGVKIQILDQTFKNQSCEVALRGRLRGNAKLVGGGDARLAGSIRLQVSDDSVKGRVQLDLVSRQAGEALFTGRAVYVVRGSVDAKGAFKATLVPVSASGDRIFRLQLEKNAVLRGRILAGHGKGELVVPSLKTPVEWKASASRSKERSKT